MNKMKKILQLSTLMALVAVLWSTPALARTDFEILVDFDEDGICDSEFFLGPYYFCTPNDQGKPDNCVEVANPDQIDTDDNGIGDACEEDDTEVITETGSPNDNSNPDLGACNPAADPNCTDPTDGDPINTDFNSAALGGGCTLISGANTDTVLPQVLWTVMMASLALGIRFRR